MPKNLIYKVIVTGFIFSKSKLPVSLVIFIDISLISVLFGGVLKKYPVLILHCLPYIA